MINSKRSIFFAFFFPLFELYKMYEYKKDHIKIRNKNGTLHGMPSSLTTFRKGDTRNRFGSVKLINALCVYVVSWTKSSIASFQQDKISVKFSWHSALLFNSFDNCNFGLGSELSGKYNTICRPASTAGTSLLAMASV